MGEISLDQDWPVDLTIAADGRISNPNYLDDQIWQLTQNSGEPQAITLQTTYGLRAKKMRMLPRFSEGHESITDPHLFPKKPKIISTFPNFIKASYSPLDSIEVTSEYWVPASSAVAGRIRITNTSTQNRQIKFEWIILLTPSENGSRMRPGEVESVPVMIGSTGDINPVVFITGGASIVDSPYPALVHGLELPPGKSRQFIWCQAALDSTENSFSLAREIAARNWEAEIARIENLNLSQVEVLTGSEEWNTAFSLSQKSALSLIVGKTSHLKEHSFVTTRHPDDGYSYRGDGSDYDPQWSGQTPLDAYYLTNIILPSAAEIAAGVLENSLASTNESGELDWKPGLGGQRSNRIATPILASIAWKIYEILEDKKFLEGIYPKLLDFFYSWFSPRHDRDEDGIPEWDHPIQAGFDDHPLFARWHSWAQGIDITTVESPSLCAFLYRECQTLIDISKILNQFDPISKLEEYKDKLGNAVEDSWNEELNTYTYWDRDSHIKTNSAKIYEHTGSGTIQINRDLSQPSRLVFRITTKEETTRKCKIVIHGLSQSKKHRVEYISSDRILWFPGWATTTSAQIYSSLEFIEINGLSENDTFKISIADLSNQDITNLLPLWANIPTHKRAKRLVEKTILDPNLFWRDYGLPACPDQEIDNKKNEICQLVYLPWCVLIGEGLISYGYRQEAAELVTRIMGAVTQNLERDGCFRQSYHADLGIGKGESNSLWGLAPVGLFLNTLGVQLISPKKLRLNGINPFPWPVTVKYRGTTVLRGQMKTQVIFSDGQTITIDDPGTCLVSLE